MRILTGCALLAASSAALAHPGGLAADGCHKERATGTRHCHPERAGGSRAAAPAPAPARRSRPAALAGFGNPAAPTTDDAAEIVRLFERMTAQDRASVIAIARSLAGE